MATSSVDDRSGIQSFDIDPRKKDECKKKLGAVKYFVIKVLFDESGRDGEEYKFHAALIKEDFILHRKHRKRTQVSEDGIIGYAYCFMGWIKQVTVEEAPIDARGCGIAKQLIHLCMTDRDVNPGDEINLKLGPKLQWDDVAISKVKNGCKKVVGLTMAASPPNAGGNAYFGAALKAGFNKMLIRKCEGGKTEWVWWTVPEAKISFNENGFHFPGYDNDWMFCKTKV